MKQTAVQWLLDNLIVEPWSEEHFKYNSECWDKALEMEKEQLKLAYHEDRPFFWGYETGEFFEEYYKETYETQND